MIPFILGGVALAATGYGVAKLFEDTCNEEIVDSFYEDDNDVYYKNIENEVIEQYKLVQVNLHNTVLFELKTALEEIDYIKTSIFISLSNFDDYIYKFEIMTDEIKQKFEEYTQIFKDTKVYINSRLDILDSIIIEEDSYEKYSDENKKFIDGLLTLCGLLNKIAESPITNDNENISREIKRSFKKLNKIIK